jgi:type IV pilus assembly protein PilC
MPLFKYEALDSQGVAIKSKVEALSQAEAASKIRNLGHFPTKLTALTRPKQTSGVTASPSRTKRSARKVKTKVITEFAREFATLQEAGLPILRSLRSLEEQEKSKEFKKVIGHIADDIEGGSTLSEAMGRHPKCFDQLFVGMVAAGEKGGVLESILVHIADFMEKAERLTAKVKNAMIYPIVVLVTAFAIMLLLMTFVIPKFEDVLTEMSGEGLNSLTRSVLAVSAWIAYDFGWAVLVGAPFALIVLTRIIRRLQIGRIITDSIVLKLPVCGELSRRVSIARWTRTLGTLLGAGVPILDAIAVTSRTTGNEAFSRMLVRLGESIEKGEGFAGTLRRSKLMPSSVVNMAAVGEESGDLDKMLLKVAEKYDYRVDIQVSALVSMLEPVVIILLGVMVLIIVLSILLPILDIINRGGMM